MAATLRELIGCAGGLPQRKLCSVERSENLESVLSKAWLDAPLQELQGRSVLIATTEQFAAACALITCDGIASRLVICPPGISTEDLHLIADLAEIDVVICDGDGDGDGAKLALARSGIRLVRVLSNPALEPCQVPDWASLPSHKNQNATQWVMLTSGTSGVPKMVIHTLETLTGAMTGAQLGVGSVWSTFYDIRRYGGLQIFLRAMIGGGTLILSSANELTSAFLERAANHGVTHISGTPSHWRRALMSRLDYRFSPRYVRLSGEIADQAILDRLRSAFPEARISHAFASTEAGVAFDIDDGLAGFPASLVGGDGAVALRVEDGTLRIRSSRTALSYVGEALPPVGGVDGFVDTGDMVELREGRYLFVGRRSGIINVGGQKIHPEEIEAVISLHPKVQMCVVRARRSPITGAIVTAEFVADRSGDSLQAAEALESEIVSLCRERLPRHMVPISIREVSTLEFAASGKMRR